MPYIEKRDRQQYDVGVKALTSQLEAEAWEPGHVNYVLTRIIRAWWLFRPRYVTLALIIGTCILVALEFWRRRGMPYEDIKLDQNGDVF